MFGSRARRASTAGGRSGNFSHRRGDWLVVVIQGRNIVVGEEAVSLIERRASDAIGSSSSPLQAMARTPDIVAASWAASGRDCYRF